MVQRYGEYTYKQGWMRGIVGEDRRGKETDRCPLTQCDTYISLLTGNLIITRFIAQSLILAGNRPHPNHSLKSTEDFIYKYWFIYQVSFSLFVG
jgi:hypothetical protein